MTALLLTYPGNGALGERLRDRLAAEALGFELRRFPDGETYARIDSEVRGRAAAILCTLRDPDERLLPLAFLADTLRELGASSVGLVAPYLAYMRQDRRFRPGEAVTSTSFARLLSGLFDWLVTVDPHLHRRRSLAEIYTKPAEIVHAAGALADWVRREVRAPVLVGPDAESEQWVSAIAQAVPCPHLVLEKTRRGDRDVTVSPVPDIGRWAGYTPVLIDDIISSAHTMAEGVRQWVAAGLGAPVCLAVHAVFAAGAYELLEAAGAARIVTADTIPHPSNALDLSAELAACVRRCLSGRQGEPTPLGPAWS